MPRKTKKQKIKADYQEKSLRLERDTNSNSQWQAASNMILQDLKKTILISLILFTLEISIFYAILKDII